jgi:hypothetical protein
MDPWKQGFVMPQVTTTEILVDGMVQWLRFKPHKVTSESYASHMEIGWRGHRN